MATNAAAFNSRTRFETRDSNFQNLLNSRVTIPFSIKEGCLSSGSSIDVGSKLPSLLEDNYYVWYVVWGHSLYFLRR
jgi:hypothetical protein